jgi:hypothetical protein
MLLNTDNGNDIPNWMMYSASATASYLSNNSLPKKIGLEQ